MGVIQHNSIGSILNQSDWEGVSTHLVGGVANLDIVTTDETQTLTNKTLAAPIISGSLTPDIADTIALGSTSKEIANIYLGDVGKLYFGLAQEDTIEHDGSQTLAFNRNAPANALKEILFYSNIAYNHTSQAPLWTINQLGTGEAAWRITHSDDTGTYNWLMGQLGRSPGGSGKLAADTVHRDLYLWLDALVPVFSAKYATDSTAGRMLLGNWWWTDGGSANARLEIRGASDEIQTIVKGHSTQTNDILQVLKSDDTKLFYVTNTNPTLGANLDGNGKLLNAVGEIYGQVAYGALYINGSPFGSSGVGINFRTTGVTPGFAATVRMTIGANAAVVPITWADCTHTGLDITSGQVLKVNGTQVVSARVVDARCDDAINSGDATTDGVIDSLRDAMIAHGLIAAA